ncbi:hypothetical protein GIB67_005029 [Kingdonia uniflora]|uniref:AP2/ERF domain-containing protein n=1 Tax=Kingdonia uniflora TaxID=39325 RepID=A0A7J7NMN7_9MAGN|nr:hypothetical protein GIB67_005029 [Kingdonia uniflora]
MEMTMEKSEENSGRHRLCMEDDSHEARKSVKRRRRNNMANCDNGHKEQQEQQPQEVNKSSTSTNVKRSSKFRGVSRHRWTGRYEAHLWDKASWNVTQKKKGKQGMRRENFNEKILFIQFFIGFAKYTAVSYALYFGLDSWNETVYLGDYDEEESAARAYDLAALRYWGVTTFTNFPVSDYEKEIEVMLNVTKEEYLASLRRKSSGFSRGVSKYRGVARHHHNGRWEARIGRVFGNKYLYLGTYSTQEEAAHAYDVAAIEYRGVNAVTNFDLSTYIRWLRPGGNNALLGDSHEPESKPESSTVPVFLNLSEKQDIFPRKIPRTSSWNKSSPSSSTALSLLLRSSIFKELVQKNWNDENGGILYDSITDIPYGWVHK